MSQAKGKYIIEVTGTGDAEATIRKIAGAQKTVNTNVDKGVKSLNRMEREVDGISRATKGLKGAWVTMSAQLDVARAAFSAVSRLASETWEAMKDGAADADIGKAFAKVFVDAEAALQKLQSATRSAVDNTSLQKFALQMQNAGLSAEQMGNVATVALQKSIERGEDFEQIARTLSEGIESGELGGLKKFGVQAKTLEEALNQLANMAEADGKLLDESTTVVFEKAGAAVDNLVSDLKVLGAQFLVTGDEAFRGTNPVKHLAELFGYIRQQRILSESVRKAEIESAKKWAEANKDVVKGLQDQLKPFEDGLNTYLNDFGTTVGEWAPDVELAAGAIARMAAELSNLSDVAGASPFTLDNEDEIISGIEKDLAGRRRGGGGRKQHPSMLGSDPFASEKAAWYERQQGNSKGPEQQLGNLPGGQSAASLNFLADTPQMTRTISDAEIFLEAWQPVVEELTPAFYDLGDAFGGMLNTLSDSGAISRTGKVAKALAAVQIAAMIAQAAVQIPFEIGQGLAAAGRYEYWAAAQHFGSATSLAIVTGMNVASVVSGVSGGGAGTSSSTAGGFVPPDLGSTSSTDGGGNVYLIVGGDIIAGDRSSGSWIADRLEDYARIGGTLAPGLTRFAGGSAGV
jgi:hypothetical protein